MDYSILASKTLAEMQDALPAVLVIVAVVICLPLVIKIVRLIVWDYINS